MGPDDAFDLARHAAADVFAVKIAQSGGLQAAGRVGRHRRCCGHRSLRRHDARGRHRHDRLGAPVRDLPQLAWGTELFGPLLLTEEILTEPLGYGDFALKVPDGPGLGIELDPDRIDFFRRDRAGTRTHSFPADTQA